MPRADVVTADAPIATARTQVSGWGGGPCADVRLARPRRVEDLRAALAAREGAIPRGMGRSYGDAAQLDGGLVLELTGLRSFELDSEHGVLTAEAGATLAQLLGAVVPAGWMLPVAPGNAARHDRRRDRRRHPRQEPRRSGHVRQPRAGARADAGGRRGGGARPRPRRPAAVGHDRRYGAHRSDRMGEGRAAARQLSRGSRSTRIGRIRSTRPWPRCAPRADLTASRGSICSVPGRAGGS